MIAFPRGLPAEVKATLEKALATAIANAETKAKLVARGFEPGFSNVATASALIQNELPAMRANVARTNITAD
ncbi:hypothetical protein PSQ20_21245 [Curvibacter sp. RS43]|uniref:hypothetical protein n=1 Tax=Curvibacter microcysteis TaxID=3026419 RepID=UPI00235F4EA2|nr:hypothetical protein [Curvibacter sp. RS43]MDD0812878.1 hypothetical protein [Curvibacter sp. RS43]